MNGIIYMIGAYPLMDKNKPHIQMEKLQYK
jgi:hypothetical protein